MKQLSQSSVKPFFLLSALTLSALPVMADIVTHSYEVSPGGDLNLTTDIGKLVIESHDRDTVEIEVDISGDNAEDFNVTHELDGNNVIVEGKYSKGDRSWGWSRDIKVAYTITVPKEFDLNLRTAGGSIRVDDLVGDLNANTSGGSIKIKDIEGDVDLHTSGGSIRTGSILGNLDAHTSGGSIEATFAKQLTEDAELRTSGGSITVYMIEDMKVELDASTSGGRVRSEFDIDGRVKKKYARGKINNGGPELTLRTSGGSVKVKSL